MGKNKEKTKKALLVIAAIAITATIAVLTYHLGHFLSVHVLYLPDTNIQKDLLLGVLCLGMLVPLVFIVYLIYLVISGDIFYL